MADVIIVLGMHRGGTSAAMFACHQLGVALGPPDTLMEPTPQNPDGYWEQWPIVRAQEGLLNRWGLQWDSDADLPPDWLARPETSATVQELAAWIDATLADQPIWGFKDPRTCRLVPLWEALCATRGLTPHYLLVVRPLAEIVASLQAVDVLTHRRTDHTAASYTALARRYLQEADTATVGRDRLVIRQADLRADPAGTLRTLAAWLPHHPPVTVASITALRQFGHPR